MTDQELKQLKDTLWHSADVLRAGAHLAANKYGQPILGLRSFLRLMSRRLSCPQRTCLRNCPRIVRILS